METKQQQQQVPQAQRTTDADELKDRVKQVRTLSLMSKDETLRMRLEHVG